MNDCILVTGGAGFIGCAISTRLVGSGLPLVVMDNLHPQVHARRLRPDALHREAVFIQDDVTRPEAWDALLSNWRPRAVIHLAAETGTGQSLLEASRHAEVNVVGTTRMLDALAAANAIPERLILTSSRAIYGEGRWLGHAGPWYPGQRSDAMLARQQWDFEGQAIPADAAVNEARPTSIYGATKFAQEQILSAWAASFRAKLTILRLQNVYGPGQSLNNPYTGIASLFVRLAKAGESIPLYEDGCMKRDFVHIDDVADAVTLAVTSTTMDNQILDIGTGLGTTISDLARIIACHYGAPEPHVTGQYRNGDVRHASCDVSNAARHGWKPRISLEQGVASLCAWVDAEMQK